MAHQHHNEEGDKRKPAANRTPVLSSTEDLIEQARDFYARRYPNPEREGCPSPQRFNRLAMDAGLPNHSLRDHLFQCSECFREYREAMTMRTAQTAAKNAALEPKRKAFWFRQPAWGWVTALVVLCAALSLALLWLRHGQPNATDLADRQTPAAISEVAPLPDQSAAPTSTLPVSPAQQNAPTPRAAARPGDGAKATAIFKQIHLEEDMLYRSATLQEQAQNSGQQYLQALYHLQIILPEGSQRGVYRISLCDVYHQSKGKALAIRSDGEQLDTRFDLRPFPDGTYYLRIAPNDETPYYYKIVLNGGQSGTKVKP